MPYLYFPLTSTFPYSTEDVNQIETGTAHIQNTKELNQTGQNSTEIKPNSIESNRIKVNKLETDRNNCKLIESNRNT